MTNIPITPKTLEEIVKDAIIAALSRQTGNKLKGAASELGISERTLYRKIKEFGIE